MFGGFSGHFPRLAAAAAATLQVNLTRYLSSTLNNWTVNQFSEHPALAISVVISRRPLSAIPTPSWWCQTTEAEPSSTFRYYRYAHKLRALLSHYARIRSSIIIIIIVINNKNKKMAASANTAGVMARLSLPVINQFWDGIFYAMATFRQRFICPTPTLISYTILIVTFSMNVS